MIYFVADEQERVKIGFTSGSPTNRLCNLQSGNADELLILATMPGGPDVENSLHHKYRHAQIRGEWFHITDELLAEIESVASSEATYSDKMTDTLDWVCLQVQRPKSPPELKLEAWRSGIEWPYLLKVINRTRLVSRAWMNIENGKPPTSLYYASGDRKPSEWHFRDANSRLPLIYKLLELERPQETRTYHAKQVVIR